MSATAPGLNLEPTHAPERLRPRVAPAPPEKRFSWGKWILVALLAGGAWAAYYYSTLSKPQTHFAQAPSIRTVKISSGTIERVLRLTGSTTAKNFASVAAPMMRGPDGGRALILIFVAPSGSKVKKGDIVARIDAQSMIDHVDDISATIEQAEADIRRRKAEQAMNWENTLQGLRVSKADWDKSKLDAGASEVRTP